jgi:hypothetical protein
MLFTYTNIAGQKRTVDLEDAVTAAIGDKTQDFSPYYLSQMLAVLLDVMWTRGLLTEDEMKKVLDL